MKGQADAVGGPESGKDLSKQNKGEGTDGQGQKKDGLPVRGEWTVTS